jgi:peptide/nickel transport system ATP-binding protein
VTNLLEIRSLSVDIKTRSGRVGVLDDVSFAIEAGETICLVGESGSGKTIAAMSVMRLIDHKGGRIRQGAVHFYGRDLASLSQREMSDLRGRRIGIVFQEPMTAFDPLFTIGAQIIEVIRRHTSVGPNTARRRAIALLERVRIADPELSIDQYPHQQSGGMLQRAMIALALACNPSLLIADEPTTALDVTIQAQILDLLKDLQAETGMAILLITHDLAIAAAIADRVIVLYAGRIVEDAPVKHLFVQPAHPYTRGLLRSIIGNDLAAGSRLLAIEGGISDLTEMPAGCRFHPRCPRSTIQCELAPPPLAARDVGEVACWHPHDEPWKRVVPASVVAPAKLTENPDRIIVRAVDLRKHYTIGNAWLPAHRPVVRAIDGVSIEIVEGETMGLVGESGSGKSTLGRLLLKMEDATSGQVEFAGNDLTAMPARDLRALRRHMQMIFQDPYGSLDPRWNIGAIVGEPLAVHDTVPVSERKERVRGLLELVGLDPRWDVRFPHQLSGGQRQRVAIARAIATEPRFIVADEAVSALDVSVRAQIINLLQDLKARLGLTYLFIGHELNLVRHMADRIGVMYQGRLVEIGPAETVFRQPAHPYTRALLAAIPEINPAGRRALRVVARKVPARVISTRGCRFEQRCAGASALCREKEPILVPIDDRHGIACHHPV